MSDLTLPIHPDNIHAELEHVEAIVKKWRTQIGEGLPGIDIPAQNAEDKLELLLQQFVGEMLFVAGKCQNMAIVLAER